MLNTELCTIMNKTKNKLPNLPFVLIKNAILGEKYDFGVSFISPQAQKKINFKYRGINTTTNILSFPLSKTSGEITFDLVKVKHDAPLFNMPYPQFLKYLFIHGLLHLKGYEHSSTMERQEKKFLKQFS
jgi:probable rRNA maturation factor